MKNVLKIMSVMLVVVMMMSLIAIPAFAEEQTAETIETKVEEVEEKDDSTSMKAIAAAITIAVVATAGAISMGFAISKTGESMARQPEIEGKLRTNLLLGLVFVETAIIYALIVAILIVFVL